MSPFQHPITVARTQCQGSLEEHEGSTVFRFATFCLPSAHVCVCQNYTIQTSVCDVGLIKIELNCVSRLEFKVKKEGWGGGGVRVVVFQRGEGDMAQSKPGGKTLLITVGDGLPKTSSECWKKKHQIQSNWM